MLHRIFTIRTIFYHSLVWAGVSTLIVIPNLLFIFLLHPWLNSLNQPTLLLLFCLVFYLNYRCTRSVWPYIGRLIRRQNFDLKCVEAHFSESILLLQRTEEMVEAFRHTVEATLRLEGVLFFIRKGEGFVEEESGGALELSKETLHWLSLLQAPLDSDGVRRRARRKEVCQEVISLLEQCSCTYIVSLSIYGELLGLVLLPKKNDGTDISLQEERFITRVTAFVSTALYNSTVYQNLNGLKEELSRHTDALAQEVAQRKKIREVAEESERRYRLLADNVLDTIAVLESQPLVFTYLSPSIERHLGYTEDELIGCEAREVLTEPSEMEVKGILKNALAMPKEQGSNALIFEAELRCKDGSVVWSEISARFLAREYGQVREILLVSRDVTERKRLEREREALQRRLRQAQKMESIGVLAGSIAHDFNNILMAMMGYTQLAMRHIPEENKVAREKIAQIDKAGVRARDLVAQILAFSRQNEQKSDVCYLREMVRDTVGFLGASLPSNIEIRFETGPGALKVIADPVQVHQIVINLATNAFHAIGEGGGTIEICVEEVVVHEAEALAFHLPEGHYVCISVRDDGHGVDPEIASRIFEPYYTTKEIGKGTGMGLAVVHGIVLNHGGTVQFESQRGRGSLFRVYLPAGDASERNSQSSEKDVDSRGAKDVILIVDGEEIFIDLAREVLGRIGYQVEAYTDATKAMEVFSEYPEKYVAVVAELFPGGEMVLKTVKGRMDDLPVVITSGLCRTEMKKELQGVGVEGMLTKPFTLKELAEELRVSIAKKKN